MISRLICSKLGHKSRAEVRDALQFPSELPWSGATHDLVTHQRILCVRCRQPLDPEVEIHRKPIRRLMIRGRARKKLLTRGWLPVGKWQRVTREFV